MFSSIAWSVRPQTLTLFCLGLTLWILVTRKYLWVLPPLFLVWSNLHGAVALGGLLVGAATVAAVVTRCNVLKMLCVAAMCAVATFLTPLGFSLWAEMAASFARLQAYGTYEWRPPALTSLRDLPFWITAVLVLLAAIKVRHSLRRTESLTLFLSSLVMFALACRTARNVPPFFLCAAPAIAPLFCSGAVTNESTSRRHIQMHAVALGLIALFGFCAVTHAWAQPASRLGWEPVSQELRAALGSCPGRLYNTYDDGGYLIWFLPDRKVFVDSRQDPFPREFIEAHIYVERSGQYKPLFARYGIACALTVRETPLDVSLRKDGWQVQGAAQNWRLYRRPGRLYP